MLNTLSIWGMRGKIAAKTIPYPTSFESPATSSWSAILHQSDSDLLLWYFDIVSNWLIHQSLIVHSWLVSWDWLIWRYKLWQWHHVPRSAAGKALRSRANGVKQQMVLLLLDKEATLAAAEAGTSSVTVTFSLLKCDRVCLCPKIGIWKAKVQKYATESKTSRI